MHEGASDSPVNAALLADVPAFVRGLTFADLPPDVVAQARRCLLDLIGVAAAGSRTSAAKIANNHAAMQFRSAETEARMLFDGRRASPAGVAFAGATTIDSFDAHDGHALIKGHAGVVVLPTLLAMIDSGATCDNHEFITALVLGYEVATRAGIALHASAAELHCSGTWNAVACAAIGARLLCLPNGQIRHALGIAEYFGPRGQLARVCDSPSMVKDGSGWGAHAGVTAALLARAGFTGAPALTVEHDDATPIWNDLGARCRIREQYFKAYPVCRWAQPAIEAALTLRSAARFSTEDIEEIAIETFAEAVALGAGCAIPSATDEAQYSLKHPVAAALVFGEVGAEEIEMPRLADPRIRRLLAATKVIEDAEFSRRFPAERWARARITLKDGRMLASEPAIARGNPENPLTDTELRGKYRLLAESMLGFERAARIERRVDALDVDPAALRPLVDDLLQAPS